MTQPTLLVAGMALAVAMALGACSAKSPIEMLEPGTYALDCSGGAPTWAGCHELAERACDGASFEIKSQVSNEGSSGVGRNDWSTAGSQITRTMVVRCK